MHLATVIAATAAVRRRCRLPLLALIAGTLLGGMEAAAQQYLRSPLDPTADDCRQLKAAHQRVVQDAHGKYGACLKGPVRFGYGPECSLVSPYKIHQNRLKAWVQCGSSEVLLCEAYATQEREFNTCVERANKRAGVDEKKLRDLRSANDAYDAVKNTWSTAHGILTRPVEFFFNRAIENTTRGLFPAWRGEVDLSSDPRAEEIYRYLQSQSNMAVEATWNPVIRAIQKESLLQIFAQFKRLTLDMNGAMSQMQRLSVQSQQVPPSAPARTERSREPPSDNSYRPTDGLCQRLGTC
jgi:hypothetical protein